MRKQLRKDYSQRSANMSTCTQEAVAEENNELRLMLFDLEWEGHHANYIRYLIRYCCEHKLPVELSIVVASQFIEKHPDVIQAANSSSASVEFLAISEQELQAVGNCKYAFSRSLNRLREWQLLCKYASNLNVDHCLILYLDASELPLMLGLEPPCPISGIYFRPTFHYQSFTAHAYPLEHWTKRLRERLFIHQMLHNPKLHTLFCLGPFADEAIKELYPQARVISLADPVEIPQTESLNTQAMLEKQGILLGRKVCLVFGAITVRKGIYQLLDSLQRLPSGVCQQLSILIVGAAEPEEQSRLCAQIDLVCQALPVQVVTHFEFVSESEAQSYFQLSDFVLAVYQRHIGMSGILLQAAAAQKPVLSSDYGLMGELVRRYQLGISVDSSRPEAIATGITQLLSADESLCDLEKMKRFVEENSVVQFAETIFQNV